MKINQLESKQSSFSVQRKIKTRIAEENEKKISSATGCMDNEGTELAPKTNLVLQITSFTCVCLVYLQFTFLLFLITLTQLRVGFVFLLVCALSICYLVLKVRIIRAFSLSVAATCMPSVCAVESAGKYGFMSQGFPWRRSAATPPKLMFRLVKPNFMLNPSKAVGLERQTLEIMLDHFRSSQNVLNFPKHKSEGPSNKSELKKPGGH